ncbi:hypothetical protein [Roseivivax sediminis]|uniref:Uncharacterized protein n=1 Tax=Roseivivax sediminis TaxID=936889 RepID=A0A1I2BX95_9RHOB|nr:hypothetical protein [Roseivivax sediminis]SFE60796.1 hypothetical protein SAMN04515678_11228 [Roseivivax sediminis]
MRFLAVILFAALAAPATGQSPIAEVICAPKDRMSDKLTRQYGAKRHATGLRSPDEVMELWRAEDGDWTLVMTYASGRSCIVAMGRHWDEHDPT